MNMSEVRVNFPYLDEPNSHGIKFVNTMRAKLDLEINHNKNYYGLPVLLYTSMGEYRYAIGSTVRYSQADIMFKVGTIVGYENDMLILRVKDEVAALIDDKIAIPRAIVKKIKEDNTFVYDIARLICIDIVCEPETMMEKSDKGEKKDERLD